MTGKDINNRVPARVTANHDPQNLGRVQVQFYWQEENATTWARLITSHAGAGRGLLITPEIGDEVAVRFEEADPERPYILGSVWNGVHLAPTQGLRGDEAPNNDIKRLVTKSGHRLQISDKAGVETIALSTPTSNRLVMTEKADETGRPAVVLHTDGDIILSAPKGRIHLQSMLQSKEVGSSGSGASTPLPTVVTPSAPSLASLSCSQKMEKAIGTANISHALLSELGGAKGIAAALATAGLTFAVLQLTPVGWAGDIAAGLLAIGVVTSGSEIVSGVKALYDSWHIACREAKTDDDLKRAGAAFADAVAKIGVNGVLLVLDTKGAKRLSRANDVANAYKEHSRIGNKDLPSYVSGTNLAGEVTHPTLQPGEKFEMWSEIMANLAFMPHRQVPIPTP